MGVDGQMDPNEWVVAEDLRPFWAVGNGHANIVRLVPEHGADLAATDNEGATPEDVPIRADDSEVGRALREPKARR